MSVLHITKENFENEVLKTEKLVLVDFWATWCGPCQMIAPVIEKIAEENTDILLNWVKIMRDLLKMVLKHHLVMVL